MDKNFFENPFAGNSQLYNIHEAQHASMAPFHTMATAYKVFFRSPYNILSYTRFGKSMAAASELMERATRNYLKPEFGIDRTSIDGKRVDVVEEVVDDSRPFGRLLHFRKPKQFDKQPKILLVAPMSGHHATLLRGTVRGLLPFADVYITDWTDAREVPLYAGKFDLDDYITYVIDFLKILKGEAHVIAVCQPAVPVMAAASIMNAQKDPAAPRSMTLMGGPIDTREAPTEVNRTATERPFSWFENTVVTRVPANYPGFMRKVYPGFLQLTGFMTMNLERHVGEHIKLFQHLVQGDDDSAEAHRAFYNEYLSVADLPAEFYLQTIDVVFQRHLLPKGEMTYLGQKVDPSKITKTALLTIEGELDDISGVGQTKAAQKLCSGLPKEKKRHHEQKAVGHYGIFNGRKFREHIIPVIQEFITQNDK
ncbi:MAG: polyhydroxyalkanoate depolymerase [Alphaproteobacteria bacterium]|nr:polyhydroxyalkanoate depolymerase [Alphaproteobacteria bacterium]